MHEFEYVAPRSVNDALKLLGRRGKETLLLAGGTDLIVKMRAHRLRPDVVVDAKHIPQLNVLKADRNGVTIGAAVSCRRVYLDRQICSKYPILVDCGSLVGGIQIQSRATLGGNLCNAAPSADTVPALIALGAVANIRGPRGSRRVPVEEICIAPGKTALKKGELLVSLRISKPARHSGARFLRFIPRNEMDIAVVNAAAAVILDAKGKTFKSARIAVGAVAPVPLYLPEAAEALAGQAVTETNIRKAAEIAAAAARPITDMRGTMEQRRHLAGVMTARAIRDAVKRARGEKI